MDEIDRELLATIIQGEAGTLGPLGMAAVALTLHCRIWQHGHDRARIERQWFGRATPNDDAFSWADLVLERRLPNNDYQFCMGGRVDVEPNNWADGDAVVRVGEESVHLYRQWPAQKVEVTGGDA